jgi:integrase
LANDKAVIHGLRHSFRDRLRSVHAPSDLIDQLGGWSHKSVGQNYGDGYDLETAYHWMDRIVLSNNG